jgi:hypothetical protein
MERLVMDSNRLMDEIAKFCSVPYSKHGRKGPDGRFKHDWADLVETIARMAYGRQPSNVTLIAARLRIEYPNKDKGWNAKVNAEGVHENILRIIMDSLEENLGSAPKPTAE